MTNRRAIIAGAALLLGAMGPEGSLFGNDPPASHLMVSHAGDRGEASLRQRILEADARPGPDTIVFDPVVFHDPQTIALESPLPELTGEVVIDGYIEKALWKATGVTLSGGGRFPVFRVAAGASVTLRHLTVADGCAEDGGAVLNLGKLVVRGVTFLDNQVYRDGGAIANVGGSVTVVNSTFAANQAADSGGALANLSGWTTVTNCTFSENSARQGGAVFSDADLLLRNSILANSHHGGDCVSERALDPRSTRNLIEENHGCGEPITSADPNLGPFGYYNGPAKTYPVGGGSPAVNLGDNAAALDEDGKSLVWDQRGSGDPRFVAGFTDLGAFEHQRNPYLSVDTVEDGPLRACTRAGQADCPLRGAIEIANTISEPSVITFDPRVFSEPRRIHLTSPLPTVTAPLTLDAADAGGVTLVAESGFAVLSAEPGVEIELLGVVVAGGEATSTDR